MTKKKIFLIVGGVIVVGGLIYMNMTMNTTNTTKVNIETAKNRELIEIVSASGRIQPQTKVDITSEVNGEIINLNVQEGDHVNSGDLLIVLDTVQLRSNFNEARYAMSEIEARLEGSKITMSQNEEEYERQKALRIKNHSSEIQETNAMYAYLNSQSSYNAMLAQSKQVKSRYENQLDKLNKAKIVAPMAGIITFLDCEVGEIAQGQTAFSQGRTLMTISNLDVFEVEVEVDETEINKVEFGQEVEIEVDAFIDTTFAGKVVEIGNTALISGAGSQDQSTNFKVKVIFNESNEGIRPGMSATVDIVSNKNAAALSIPYSAVVMRAIDMDSLELSRLEVVTDDTESSDVNAVNAAEVVEDENLEDSEKENEEIKGVFIVRDGKAMFLKIETGIADQKNIQITEGIINGDSIISGPYKVLRSLKDGDHVEKLIKKKKE